MVAACECNPNGAATFQCERNTGKCECVDGIGGHKCDRCARGTTGQLPFCEPCGECFDNWDRIIEELKSKRRAGALGQARNGVVTIQRQIWFP